MGSIPLSHPIYRAITQRLEWGAYISLVVGSNPTCPTKICRYSIMVLRGNGNALI